MTAVGNDRLYSTWFTSTADGYEHAVTDDEFARSRRAGGEPASLCGHRVLLVPLTVPPGPHCRGCTRVLQAHVAPTLHRKPSMIRRLLRKLPGQSGVLDTPSLSRCDRPGAYHGGPPETPTSDGPPCSNPYTAG